MRSQHLAMSWERFEQLPPHPGWKHEYWDGVAHITPGARFAVVRIDAQPRPIRSPLELRAIAAADETLLVSAYLDAFRDTVEYCDWEEDAIAQSARENVRAFCAGRRGEALFASSCLATDPAPRNAVEAVVGAALLMRTEDGHPMLDMLFVRPRWQRRGLATALLSWCLRELHRRGDTILRSRYHLANEASQAWHRNFGFIEEPDLLLAQLYLRCATQELRRREKMGGLIDEERGRLLAETDRWERCVEQLERVADQQGWEAVSPTLRVR
jgi:GNAT superfamily N-acetyltransferase